MANQGIYTDTQWVHGVEFSTPEGNPLVLSGTYECDVIIRGTPSTPVFTFNLADGTLDHSLQAAGKLTLIATPLQHAAVAASTYRLHMRRVDGGADLWATEGEMLVGKPGDLETYIRFASATDGSTASSFGVALGGPTGPVDTTTAAALAAHIADVDPHANYPLSFATRAAVTATNLSGLATGETIHVRGHTTEGVGGAAYIKLGSTPSPVSAWHVQSSDGAYWEIKVDQITPMMLGAVDDGVTNDEIAIQHAIDYCHQSYPTKKLSLGDHSISTSLIINRDIDALNTADWFVVSGGSIKVSSAIPVFTSSTPFTVAPVSQTVLFDGVKFLSTNNLLDAYVLHGSRFLRIQFNNCTFDAIRCLSDAVVYTQSIVFNGINARYWTGTFFNSPAGAYDVKVGGGCLIEQGEDFMVLYDDAGSKSVAGCSFIGSVIEGLNGTALRLRGSRGFMSSGMYFEGNAGPDYNFTGGTKNRGIALTGNLFAQSAANKATPSYASIEWGETDGGWSSGNFCDGRLHKLPATAFVDIGNDVSLVEVVHNTSANKTGFVSNKLAFGSVNPQTTPASYGSRTWLTGAVVFNESGVGGTGWRCTSGGAPGTWQTFGLADEGGYYPIRRDSDTQILGYFSTATPTANQTTLFLYQHNGTAASLQRVTVGAADSGGTGFRALRVPN